jgi:hypothetical protein
VSNRVALIVLVVVTSCGNGEPSTDETRKEVGEARVKAATACNNGDGAACFIAVVGLDYTDKNQLAIAKHAWERGCYLAHAASCAQLGTVAEFGMDSGGAHPDQATAFRYYKQACVLGDAKSCKHIGAPLPAGVKDPDAPPPFNWREALEPVCGQDHGDMGALFAGFEPGKPMPDAMKAAIANFEKKYKAKVHYFPGDPLQQNAWSLRVRYEERDGMYPILVARWGKPDAPFGVWQSSSRHLSAGFIHDGRSQELSWGPYHSADELIKPDDKDLLGFEPIRLVGTTVTAARSALGDRMRQIGALEYQIAPFTTIDNPFELHATEEHGVITELRAYNWFTNSPEAGDQLFAALETKWGKPTIGKDGVHTWRPAGRVVRASKPASGNFEITISKR